VGGAQGQAHGGGGSNIYFKGLAVVGATFVLWPLPLLAVLVYGCAPAPHPSPHKQTSSLTYTQVLP
jgi:hypothetical protein